MAAVFGSTFQIRGDDASVSFRMLQFEPGKQRRTEIKTDVRVVVHDQLQVGLLVNNTNSAIRQVTFGVNALVPVVKRLRTWLRIDASRPGIFSWRLVEMPVNNQWLHLFAEHSILCKIEIQR